jgi:cytochrome oxidase assembly protein ShyY1
MANEYDHLKHRDEDRAFMWVMLGILALLAVIFFLFFWPRMQVTRVDNQIDVVQPTATESAMPSVSASPTESASPTATSSSTPIEE